MKRIWTWGITAAFALTAIFPMQMEAKKVAAKRKTTAITKRRSAASGPAVVKGETKSYGDYLTTEVFTIKKGESEISVQYPVSGNPELVQAIRSFIVKSIDSKASAIPASPEAVLKKVMRGYSSKGSAGAMCDVMTQEITVTYCNGNVITVNNQGYEYMGGAHGASFDNSVTFLVSTGESLTTDMLPSISKLRPYLVRSLAGQFEIPTSEWNDIFQVPINELEYGTPFVDASGLNFQYGAYEIGPWAMGMPRATISLSEARSLLSGKAAEFLK